MPEFKITIITINFNNAAGLLKTIQSVISQKAVTFEYIVIDGGSADISKDVITQYKDHINYWISEKDSGIYNAMNKGIKAAKGEFILFLNSGDQLVNDNVLTKTFSKLDNFDIVYGDIITEDLDGNNKLTLSPDKLDANYLINKNLWHPSAFIRKELFNKFGLYNEAYRIASDYDFFVKAIVKYKVTTKHINLPISVFDLNGISNDEEHFNLMLQERTKIQQTWFDSNQLENARLLDIQTLGRKSHFFRYIPNFEWIKKRYDAFYYQWYKWRTGN